LPHAIPLHALKYITTALKDWQSHSESLAEAVSSFANRPCVNLASCRVIHPYTKLLEEGGTPAMNRHDHANGKSPANRIDLSEKRLRKADYQFLFPFSLKSDCRFALLNTLKLEGFTPFRLDKLDMEEAFYGQGHRVSHKELERYFLPYANHILFPSDDSAESFRRMSKRLEAGGTLRMRSFEIPFKLHSVDVILCPFDTSFLTLRIHADKEALAFTEAVEFAARFRTLQDVQGADRATDILYDGEKYSEIQDFIFKGIVPHMVQYLDRTAMDDTYFEQLPYFTDERMYVMASYAFPEELDISVIDRYRAARLDGCNDGGNPDISACHLPYIKQYCRDTGLDRWAPHVFYQMDENSFCCLNRLSGDEANAVVGKLYGEYYYALLLNLFHRIVLLKLSDAYSRVQMERDSDKTERLIRDITRFSAKYNFPEIVSPVSGCEVFARLHKLYRIEQLYGNVRQTLNDLYEYQKSTTSRRSSYLLTILTIYTVISGIYGMNQVIDDLEHPILWSRMDEYSPFQWIALAVALSGLVVAFLLSGNVLWKWGRELLKRSRN